MRMPMTHIGHVCDVAQCSTKYSTSLFRLHELYFDEEEASIMPKGLQKKMLLDPQGNRSLRSPLAFQP